MNRQPRIRFIALTAKVQNRKLRFFKTTLIINPSLHQTKQFLCVTLAKEPNGFREPLLEQSVPGILRFRSETLETLRSNDQTATRKSLKKSVFACLQSLKGLFVPNYFVQCRRSLLKLNFKGLYPSSKTQIKFRRCLFTSSIKH